MGVPELFWLFVILSSIQPVIRQRMLDGREAARPSPAQAGRRRA